MSDKNLEKISAYIKELDERTKKYQASVKKEILPMFDKQHGERRPPKDFVDSSFLYIRSCDGDIGNRPVPCPAFWLSPDIQVAPISNLGMPTRELIAGQVYRISCTVRNRGDLIVPSAKVEFFLANPTLGFDTRFATKLGVAAGWVNPHAATTVSLDYLVPPDLSGHRCLFARVFAFSPLDIPVDDYALNPPIDRHVAQLNLDIIQQNTPLQFDWVHLPNARQQIELVPMQEQTLRALRHELVAGFKITGQFKREKVLNRVKFEFEKQEGQQIDFKQDDGVLNIFSHNEKAVPLEKQAAIQKEVGAALQAVQRGRRNLADYKPLLREYRAMNKQAERTRLTLHLPDFDLKSDQAVALHLISRNMPGGEITGGVGLIVTG